MLDKFWQCVEATMDKPQVVIIGNAETNALEIHARGATFYTGRCPACGHAGSEIALAPGTEDQCRKCGRKWRGEQRAGEFVGVKAD